MTPDQERLTTLYRAVGPIIYRRALRLLGDEAAAEDAAQEIFLKMARRLEEERPLEESLPWIYAVTANHCLNVLRNEGRRARLAPLAVAEAAVESGYPDRQLVQSVLEKFDAGTQAVAVGVLVDGMEQREVASALGVSAKTVQRRLAKFMTAARQLLGGER